VSDPAVSPTPWRSLPAELVPVLRARLETIVATVADQITGSVFGEVDDDKVARDVHRGVRVAMERFVELVGTDEPALPARVRETFLELGAAEAREERTPETLLSALRTAARVMLRTTSDALAEVRPLDTDDLIDLSDAITAYVDELATASTDGFTLQLRQQVGESDRRRRLLAELLLRGGASERDVLGAAEGIGWRRIDALVPVVLPPEQTGQAQFHYREDAVVVEREHDTVLVLRQGRAASREMLAGTLRGRGAVVGPTVHWTRLPEAVRLAELTAQLTASGGSTGSLDPVFVEDHLARLALRGEHGAFAVLSERSLAPFADLREATRLRLLETLASWLRHWGSRGDVAIELGIHPQTVSYRVRQLRGLLGDDLDDVTARFELLLALTDRPPWLAASGDGPSGARPR
jgi:hypothetical protein